MKIFRNRTFLGIGSFALALIICFLVAPGINKVSNKQTPIVRVTKSIPEGTAITKDMIQITNVGSYNLPANVLKDEKSVVGKYATAKLEPGDNILDSKVSEAKSNYLSDLDGKKEAISISIKSFAAGLSGKLQSGDVVSLVVSDYGESKQTTAPPELRYVKLLAATTAKGTDTDQTKQDTKETDVNKDSDNIPATLTLLVTAEQATRLVDYETNGKLYATLVYRGSSENAKKYLDIQDECSDTSIANQTTQSSIAGTGGTASNGQ